MGTIHLYRTGESPSQRETKQPTDVVTRKEKRFWSKHFVGFRCAPPNLSLVLSVADYGWENFVFQYIENLIATLNNHLNCGAFTRS
jgi:hypothetical protein